MDNTYKVCVSMTLSRELEVTAPSAEQIDESTVHLQHFLPNELLSMIAGSNDLFSDVVKEDAADWTVDELSIVYEDN